jgi:hypothetical protein
LGAITDSCGHSEKKATPHFRTVRCLFARHPFSASARIGEHGRRRCGPVGARARPGRGRLRSTGTGCRPSAPRTSRPCTRGGAPSLIRYTPQARTRKQGGGGSVLVGGWLKYVRAFLFSPRVRCVVVSCSLSVAVPLPLCLRPLAPQGGFIGCKDNTRVPERVRCVSVTWRQRLEGSHSTLLGHL